MLPEGRHAAVGNQERLLPKRKTETSYARISLVRHRNLRSWSSKSKNRGVNCVCWRRGRGIPVKGCSGEVGKVSSGAKEKQNRQEIRERVTFFLSPGGRTELGWGTGEGRACGGGNTAVGSRGQYRGHKSLRDSRRRGGLQPTSHDQWRVT